MREFCKGLMMAALLGAVSFLSFSPSAKAQQEPTGFGFGRSEAGDFAGSRSGAE